MFWEKSTWKNTKLFLHLKLKPRVFVTKFGIPKSSKHDLFSWMKVDQDLSVSFNSSGLRNKGLIHCNENVTWGWPQEGIIPPAPALWEDLTACQWALLICLQQDRYLTPLRSTRFWERSQKASSVLKKQWRLLIVLKFESVQLSCTIAANVQMFRCWWGCQRCCPVLM